MGGMLGLGEVSADETANKMRETLDVVKRINAQFKNPVSFALQLLIVNAASWWSLRRDLLAYKSF